MHSTASTSLSALKAPKSSADDLTTSKVKRVTNLSWSARGQHSKSHTLESRAKQNGRSPHKEECIPNLSTGPRTLASEKSSPSGFLETKHSFLSLASGNKFSLSQQKLCCIQYVPHPMARQKISQYYHQYISQSVPNFEPGSMWDLLVLKNLKLCPSGHKVKRRIFRTLKAYASLSS